MEFKSVSTSGDAMDLVNHYIDGYRATMIMVSACELGIPDKVASYKDGVSAADLAQSEGWNLVATSRFMDSLASLKFLSKCETDSGKQVFKIADPGRHLLTAVPGTILPIVPFQVTYMHTILRGLEKIVKEGPPKPGETCGEGEGDDHGHGEGHGEGKEAGEHEHDSEAFGMLEHYQAVGSCLSPYLKELIKAFDLSKFKTVVDLGAGSGEFTFALRKAYPSMQITMNELPTVIELLEKYILPKKGKDRITLLPGSFLDVDLPKADLFIICKTLHHFDRDKQVPLIRKVFNSTNSGGAFMILEKILYKNRAGPATGNIWDVFCLTDGEGLMSTECEYRQLLEEAGFRDVELARTNDDCPYDVMIGRKP